METIHKKNGRLHIYVRQDKYKGELKSRNWVGRTSINGKQKVISSGTTNLGSASAELGHIFIADGKKIQFGDGQDSTIEYDEAGDDVLQIAGANVRIGHGAATQLQFRDSAVHLSSDADGYLNAQADTGITLNINGADELTLTSSAATFAGNLVIPDSGYIGSASDTDALKISATGLVTVSSTAIL